MNKSSSTSSIFSRPGSDLSELFSAGISSTSSSSTRSKRNKSKESKKQTHKQPLSSTVKSSNFSSKENDRTLLSLITRGRISQRTGLYSKGKTSETISRRRPLADINQQSNEQPPRDDLPKLTFKEITQINSPKISPISECSSSPLEDAVHMDVTATNETTRIKDTSLRIINGLQADKNFSEEDYTANIKAELRKLMKQSNPSIFNEMESCLTSDHHQSTSPVSTYQPHPSTPPPQMPSPQQQIDPPTALSPTKLTPLDDCNSISSYYLSSSCVQSQYNIDTICPMFVDNTINVPMYIVGAEGTEPSHEGHSCLSFSILQEPQDMEQQQTYYLPDLSLNPGVFSSPVHTASQQDHTGTDFLDYLDQSNLLLQIQGSVERPRMFPHKLH